MLTLLLACATAPALTVTCTDSTGAEVFRSTCPADGIQIYRTRHGAHADCYPYGGLWRASFRVDADSCRALPEVEGG